MKNYLLITTATSLSLAASIALAGGSTPMMPATSSTFSPHAYIEAMTGYANTAWSDITGDGTADVTFNYTKNDSGGFAWGADIGYQWTSWLAVELGGFKLPTTDLEVQPTGAPSTYSGSIEGSIFYLAAKLSHTINKKSLFTKVGLNYQNTQVSDSLSSGDDGINSNIYYGPFFGVGMSYACKPYLSFKIEYDRASGQADHGGDNYAPNPNIFVAGLSYSFG